MQTTTNTYDVAVLGGGVLGVSTALHLARKGASVVLVTEGELASGASGRSLSWLNSAGERSEPYHRLRMAGIDRYRTLFAADPDRAWLKFDGGVFWEEQSAGSILDRHAYENAHAYDSHLVTPDQDAVRKAGINPEAVQVQAILNPGEGWVSLPDLIDHLIEEFTLLGGRVVLQAGQGRVLLDDEGRAVGVSTTAAGEFRAAKVLVACGAQTPDVVRELGVEIPNGSPVSMLVLSEPVDHALKTVLNTPRAAVRPNPGGTVAVDHDWYKEHIVPTQDGGYDIPTPVVEELLGEAAKLLDGVSGLKAASWKIGLKPIPGDGEPCLGALRNVPGCFVAFTHSGATLALIVGELLAEEIHDGADHPMLRTFRPERFAAAGQVS